MRGNSLSGFIVFCFSSLYSCVCESHMGSTCMHTSSTLFFACSCVCVCVCACASIHIQLVFVESCGMMPDESRFHTLHTYAVHLVRRAYTHMQNGGVSNRCKFAAHLHEYAHVHTCTCHTRTQVYCGTFLFNWRVEKWPFCNKTDGGQDQCNTSGCNLQVGFRIRNAQDWVLRRTNSPHAKRLVFNSHANRKNIVLRQ